MKQPRFWNRPPSNPGLIRYIMAPLSAVYRLGSAYKWSRGEHFNPAIPVVCVGNLTLGGTGKTPTVIDLTMRLTQMGKQPYIVTRGYKGSLQGPIEVDLAAHTADAVGDEPLLLAAFAPTIVAKNRADGARAAKEAGADIILLDDGMQNPSVAKDATIMVVDAAIGFGNEAIFPAGPLRETLDSGLEKTDLVLAIGSNSAVEKIKAKIQSHPVLHGAIEVLNTGMDWTDERVLAFAGIGRPQKFFDSLSNAGAHVVQTRSFGDHQKLPVSILQRLEAEARSLNAQLVTTEKDAARLPKDWQQKVLTLPVRLKIQQDDALDHLLQGLFN